MDEIIKKIKEFNTSRKFEKYHTIKNLICALNVEASELLELVQWNEYKIIDNMLYLEEIADCFIYLLNICSKLDMDEEFIKKIILDKIKQNEIKYPEEYSMCMFD